MTRLRGKMLLAAALIAAAGPAAATVFDSLRAIGGEPMFTGDVALTASFYGSGDKEIVAASSDPSVLDLHNLVLTFDTAGDLIYDATMLDVFRMSGTRIDEVASGGGGGAVAYRENAYSIDALFKVETWLPGGAPSTNVISHVLATVTLDDRDDTISRAFANIQAGTAPADCDPVVMDGACYPAELKLTAVTIVPLPAALPMLAAALGGLGLAARRRRG